MRPSSLVLIAALALSGASCAREATQIAPPTVATPALPPPPALARSTPEAGVALEDVTVQTRNGAFRFQVEVVDTPESTQRGLMYRETLAPDRGMLFLFPVEEPRAFWMKNTPLPLDIIYIQSDGTIYSIAKNTTPRSEALIPSNGPVNTVLEVNGGTSDRLGIEPGDKLVRGMTAGG